MDLKMKQIKIALLLDFLEPIHMYQLEIIKGFVSILPEYNIDLFVVVGGSLDPIQSSGQQNQIYELVTKDNFAGIIMTTSLGMYSSINKYNAFLERFDGLPVVFIGTGPAEYNQIVVDNRMGMEKIVRHFIRDHCYRRIAFITGPQGNMEAEARFEAYKAVLAESGLPFDPDFVYQGRFASEDGTKAVTAFLDERKLNPDAIIASNDAMAIWTMNELERRGIKIPLQIAVAGFDDTMEASSAFPALTTARQPFRLMGKLVFEKLIAMIHGDSVAAREYVPAELVIRQSCGCLSEYRGFTETKSVRIDEKGEDAFFESRRIVFLHELEKLQIGLYIKLEKEQAVRLFTSIYRHLITGPDDLSAESLFALLSEMVKSATDASLQQEVLTLARGLLLPLFRDSLTLEKAEYFFHSARTFVTALHTGQMKSDEIESLRLNNQISLMSENLVPAVETPELREVIYRSFPSISMKNFLIAEYVRGSDGKEYANLIALIQNGAQFKGKKVLYSSQVLFPGNEFSFSSNPYFVMPLICQGERLGYVIYGKNEWKQTLYSIITRELAKSLYICTLIKKRKAAEASLERRNKDLQDFAQIASHDLQEPLRKIMVFGEKLEQSLPGKTSETEMENLKRMLHATTRMNDLITGLLSYSRVSMQAPSAEMLDLNTVIAEVLTDLEVRINETRGRVEAGRLPSIIADPLQMRQLFQNLIGNALKYHKQGVPPVIDVKSVTENKYHTITVTDNGIGFDPRNSERIFGMFQRAVDKKEYEGTGVGLAICKKIVEHLGGSIIASGDLGKGSVFTVKIPVTPA
jgi:DNA-binding LacI/PurR family transcriptional regulator/signal transduction histidine kinase